MQTIKINKAVKANFRANTARAHYYAAFAKHNGQSVAKLNAYIQANPTKFLVPGGAKLKGQLEPLGGWVSFFTRSGNITVS